jgi:hypothetical protein
MMNTITALMKRPQLMATSSPDDDVPRTVLISEKSTPPRAQPMGGMMMSLTNEFTTAPSDAPMITPMARARALDLVRNSLKPPTESA